MSEKRQKKRTTAQQKQERVRYEVYGMPVEDIIASAMAAEKAANPAPDVPESEPEPAWPSLEELQAGSARRRGSRRGR
jgi:hypothetical protein